MGDTCKRKLISRKALERMRSTYVNESESEEETFDNDLHIEQLELIDTLKWRMTVCIVDFERAAKLHFQVLVLNVVGIIMCKHYGESVRKLD